MKLSELRTLAAARTPGKWVNNGNDVNSHGPSNTGFIVAGTDPETGHDVSDVEDIDFIAAMGNHIDALLDVAEAAKAFEYYYHEYYRGTAVEGPFKKLIETLAALEKK